MERIAIAPEVGITMRNYLGLLGFVLRDHTRYLRYAIRLLTKPDRVALHGVQVPISEGATPRTRRALYRERYERSEARALILTLEPRDVVLELGTGLGFLSALCAKRIGSDRIHSVEANPRMISLIEQVHALNDVQPEVLHAVLGRGAGEREFFIHREFASSSLTPSDESTTAVRVPQLDLNEQMARIRPTYLIMDVEGAEDELFRTIDLSTVRKILVELHAGWIGEARMAEILRQVEEQGFRLIRALSSRRKKYLER